MCTKHCRPEWDEHSEECMKSTCIICNSDKHSTNQHYADIMYNVEMTRK